jgi:hypothetical protein
MILASVLLWPIIWPLVPRKGKTKPVVKQGFVISQSARAVARADREQKAMERFVASL